MLGLSQHCKNLCACKTLDEKGVTCHISVELIVFRISVVATKTTAPHLHERSQPVNSHFLRHFDCSVAESNVAFCLD